MTAVGNAANPGRCGIPEKKAPEGTLRRKDRKIRPEVSLTYFDLRNQYIAFRCDVKGFSQRNFQHQRSGLRRSPPSETPLPQGLRFAAGVFGPASPHSNSRTGDGAQPGRCSRTYVERYAHGVCARRQPPSGETRPSEGMDRPTARLWKLWKTQLSTGESTVSFPQNPGDRVKSG